MSNPDFSQSPQHVKLAKEFASVNYEAWNGSRPDDVDAHWKEIGKRDKGVMLAMADAAITHLGSGYVLPEANEANAERLARAAYELDAAARYFDGSWDTVSDEIRDKHMVRTRRHLRALRAAFGDAEKPNPADYSDPNSPADPTFCREGCDKPFGHAGQHSDEDAATYGEDKPSRSADYDGGPDFSAEAAERERERLTEAFMLALAGNPAVMAKMLESPEGDEAMIAAAVADMAQHLAQELIE